MSDPPSVKSPPLRYETVTDLGAAERILPAWNELLDRSRCNPAFSAPIWFLGACQVQPGVAQVWRVFCPSRSNLKPGKQFSQTP
jgi:hypothetical protein